MTYTLDISLALGSSKTGLSLIAQLVDSSLSQIGSPVSTGFREVGNGYYLWHYENFPDSFRGGVKFYVSGNDSDILSFVSINPQEAENVDVKISNMQVGANSVSVNVGHSSVVTSGFSETSVGDNSTINISTGIESLSPNVSISDNKKVLVSEITNITTGTQGSSVQITPGVR